MTTAVATPATGLGLALVRQELECGVCLDLYERPVTLACGHSLCENCAKHMVGMEKSGSAFIRCPHCRAKTRWKSGKANLKVNITLQNMVDRVKKAQKVEEEQRKEQERQRKEQEEKEAKRLAKAKAKAKAKTKAKEWGSTTVSPPIRPEEPQPQPAAAATSPRQASPPTAVTDPEGCPSVSPPAGGPLSPALKTKAKAKGKDKGYSSGSAPFGAIAEGDDEMDASTQPNPDAVAAFDAAIAPLVSQGDSRGRGRDQKTADQQQSSSPTIALHGAQELSLPTTTTTTSLPARPSTPPLASSSTHSSCSEGLTQPAAATAAASSSSSSSPSSTSPRPQHLLDEVDEGMLLLLPFAEESLERKMERRERRERSSRSGRDSGLSEWEEARDRISRSCHSRSPPLTRGRPEHRTRSQETDLRSRSRSRKENETTIVYDGIPEEYFQMLMGQDGPIKQVEEATNSKIQATSQQGVRGISIRGHPDDVRRARKQLVALIREEALLQDRWTSSSSSGEAHRSVSSSPLVKKKMNISRRQYDMLLSNDLQLLHSIEATTDTSVIFPTNINARAASVPIVISGKREGVNITVDFLKANEDAADKSSSSTAASVHPARSQSTTVATAPRANATRSLGSSRSATHGRRRRRRIPATEGRVPGCVIS